MADFGLVLKTTLENKQASLPANFNIDRFVTNGVALLNENKVLQDFYRNNPKSAEAQIKEGMLRAAFLGLDFMSKEVYLVPYGSKLDFSIDYRGKVKLAKLYSVRPVKDIYAKVVRAGDEFYEEVVNGAPTVHFKPLPFNNGDIVGAFAVCLFADGGMLTETMSRADIDTVRSKSRSGSGANSPWTQFYGEMAKKSVIHRLCKQLELDFTTEQRQVYDADMELADTRTQMQNDVALNANTEAFVVDSGFTEVIEPRR